MCNPLKLYGDAGLQHGFHAVDRGSNPLGDAKKIQVLAEMQVPFLLLCTRAGYKTLRTKAVVQGPARRWGRMGGAKKSANGAWNEVWVGITVGKLVGRGNLSLCLIQHIALSKETLRLKGYADSTHKHIFIFNLLN